MTQIVPYKVVPYHEQFLRGELSLILLLEHVKRHEEIANMILGTQMTSVTDLAQLYVDADSPKNAPRIFELVKSLIARAGVELADILSAGGFAADEVVDFHFKDIVMDDVSEDECFERLRRFVLQRIERVAQVQGLPATFCDQFSSALDSYKTGRSDWDTLFDQRRPFGSLGKRCNVSLRQCWNEYQENGCRFEWWLRHFGYGEQTLMSKDAYAACTGLRGWRFVSDLIPTTTFIPTMNPFCRGACRWML